MRRLLISIGILVVLAGAGFGLGRVMAPCSAPVAALNRALGLAGAACPPIIAATPEPPHQIEPPAVTVAQAAKRPFVDRLFVSGTLVAREEVQVAARIDGLTITEVDAEDGDRVEAGQILARLDRTQLDALAAQNDASMIRANAAIDQAQSLIEQSQAQVEFNRSDVERARSLAGGILSASAIEQRETSLKTAQAQLDAARHALAVAQADRKSREAERRELDVRISRTDVVAPVAGIVSRRSAKVGASASAAGDPMFLIIQDGAIDLQAEVAEQSLPKLAVGMPAQLKLPGVEGTVAATVRLVNEEIDKASRTGKVRLSLSDVSHARVGAFASGEVDLVTREGVGAPAAALRRDGDLARLLVVRDGRVEERKVTPGIVEGDVVEIRSGVAAGETIVARASAFLRPGDRVRALPETPAGG